MELLIGLFIGFFLGMLAIGLCRAAKQGSEMPEYLDDAEGGLAISPARCLACEARAWSETH